MRLTIEIGLGSETMRTGDDVALLFWVMSVRGIEDGELVPGHGGGLADINGNSVGTWRVES